MIFLNKNIYYIRETKTGFVKITMKIKHLMALELLLKFFKQKFFAEIFCRLWTDIILPRSPGTSKFSSLISPISTLWHTWSISVLTFRKSFWPGPHWSGIFLQLVRLVLVPSIGEWIPDQVPENALSQSSLVVQLKF